MRPVTVSLASALLSAFAASAVSQTYPTKPGLWVTANQTLMNGNRLPGVLEVKNALTPQQRQSLVQAMAQLGLPSGWSPSLSCETATQVTVQDQLHKAKMEGCSVSMTEQRLDAAKFKLTCAPKSGSNPLAAGPLVGTGEVTGIGSDAVKFSYRAQTTVQGKPLNFESESVSKWVGSDCQRLPPGVDATLLGS